MKNLLEIIGRLLILQTVPVVFVVLLSSALGLAQPNQIASPLGGTTPVGMARGEEVGMFNGLVNQTIPLLQVGGRGGAGYTITKQIDTPQFVVQSHVNYFSCPGPLGDAGGDPCTSWSSDVQIAQNLSMGYKRINYSPGVIEIRHVGTDFQASYQGSIEYYARTHTVVVFKTPNGEQTLYDEKNGGNQLQFSQAADLNRGKTFTALDGSELTFISDEDIDDYNSSASSIAYPSGYLKTKDGTASRIEFGEIVWMQDHNGNRTTFTSGTNSLKITDSNGREVNVAYNVQDGNGLCDRITYKGTNGADRLIRVGKSTVGNRLRPTPGYTPGNAIFPQLGGGAPLSYGITSDITLPDGRKYEFYYNEFGELARFESPTGAVEYSYGLADDAANPHYASGQVGNAVYNASPFQPPPVIYIYRRIKERRIYASGGTNASLKTTYSTLNYSGFTVKEDQIDASSSAVLTRTLHHFNDSSEFSLRATGPMDGLPDYPLAGREIKTENLDPANDRVLASTENEWMIFCGDLRSYCISSNTPWGTYLKSITTNILDTVANQYKTAKKEFTYDVYNNLTDTKEYDFGNGTVGIFSRRSHTDYVTDSNYVSGISARLLNLPSQQWISSDINGNSKASLTQFEYDNYSGGSNAAIMGRTNAIGHNAVEYGTSSLIKRGNLTAVKTYSNAQNPSGAITTYFHYDILGNVVEAIDGKDYHSTISYEDNFGIPNGEAQTPTAPTALNSQKTYAFPTSMTNALNWTTGYSQFDYYTGQPVDTEDLNGVVNTAFYIDPLDRPTQMIAANNQPNYRRQTTFVYNDQVGSRKVTTTGDLFNFNDNLNKGETLYDGMGRASESRKYEANGGYIAVQTSYDALDRPNMVSTPFRPAEITTGNPIRWTQIKFDSLGRSYETETPDGAKVTTSYTGNTITVTDQTGKQRRSIMNALGQLIRVDEPTDTGGLGAISTPNQPTYYDYDPLNNLTTVKQGGTLTAPEQTRSFTYSSLSMLKSATNPESGTITYSYDDNGNLTSKIDARSITTTYAYDALNRTISRSYSDGVTLPVAYTYDDKANAKGKLTKVTTGSGTTPFAITEYQSFDTLGRITQSQQTIDGVSYGTTPQTYTYNLSGAMVEQKYPSGRVVKNVLDNDGDLAIVQSKKNQNAGYFNYAKSFAYTAAGAVSSMQLGNGKWESTSFNSRLQPMQIALGTTQNGTDKLKLNFAYNTPNSTTDNNGNVISQTITTPSETQGNTTYPAFTATQTYSYDALNRLKSAEETSPTQPGWKQTYLYDRYGNRRFDTANNNTTTLPLNCVIAVCNPTVDPATNRLVGYTFDNAGNTKVDAENRTFIYDAENKQTEVIQNSVSLGKYYYDGDGKRVKKVSATETTIFIYDAAGKLVAEYANQTSTTPQVSYLTSDHLGSPRVNTDQNGVVISRHDYHPFGEEIARTSYGGDEVRKQFTGYERDKESNLDFAQARYYGYNSGRFMNPDPLMSSAFITEPQSFNRYSYVMNNPLNIIDPSGLCGVTAGSTDGTPCIWLQNGDSYQSISQGEYGDGSGFEGWSQVSDPSNVRTPLGSLNGTYADDAEYQSFMNNGTVVRLGENGRFVAAEQTTVAILDDVSEADAGGAQVIAITVAVRAVATAGTVVAAPPILAGALGLGTLELIAHPRPGSNMNPLPQTTRNGEPIVSNISGNSVPWLKPPEKPEKPENPYERRRVCQAAHIGCITAPNRNYPLEACDAAFSRCLSGPTMFPNRVWVP